jgi:hypothetical protein
VQVEVMMAALHVALGDRDVPHQRDEGCECNGAHRAGAPAKAAVGGLAEGVVERCCPMKSDIASPTPVVKRALISGARNDLA